MVVPLYYSSLFLEDVSTLDIISFNQILFYKYKDKAEEKNLIEQLLDKNIPKVILYKYWLRLYTLNGNFYRNLNEDLRKSSFNICSYFPFIKTCYEGVRKHIIQPEIDSILYRGTSMTKEEFEQIDFLYQIRLSFSDLRVLQIRKLFR